MVERNTKEASHVTNIFSIKDGKAIPRESIPNAVDNALQNATGIGLKCVLVLGYDNDGDIFITMSDMEENDFISLTEKAKHKLLTHMENHNA